MDNDWGPLLIYAEGSCTNGKNISRFRRGAFESLVAVQPVYFKFDHKTVSCDYATLKGVELAFLMCSEFALQRIDCHQYPIFVPNDYLFTEYAKTIEGYEKMDKCEIYAHAVQDFLKREGGFGQNDMAIRDKMSLQKFVWGDKDEITINEKTFYWPPRNEYETKSDSDKKDD